MNRGDIESALHDLLMDSAVKFDIDDLTLFINSALTDLSRVRPLKIYGELALVADQSFYDAPADLIKPLYSDWGKTEQHSHKPWDSNWIGYLPGINLVVQSGVRKLLLSPSPSAEQINIIGSTYTYFYSSTYVLEDTDAASNVPDALRETLLVRALAAAMFALANRGITKPVVVGKAGIGGMPKNGSPAYLAEEYLKLFERMAT